MRLLSGQYEFRLGQETANGRNGSKADAKAERRRRLKTARRLVEPPGRSSHSLRWMKARHAAEVVANLLDN